MAGRMESHALAFQEVLKHERGNLDEAMNQQKADMLQRYFLSHLFELQDYEFL